MSKRYLAVWFPELLTDWKRVKRPELCKLPLVFADKVANQMVISSVSTEASASGITLGMPLADARAILPELEVVENQGYRAVKVLKHIGRWAIRYSPLVMMDGDDGLVIDFSGCCHLWGGERAYFKAVIFRFRELGYHARGAIADTMGAAWAVSRYGRVSPIVPMGKELDFLLPLPPMALRIEGMACQKLIKLGLTTVGSFISMPRSVLRRRIGEAAVLRIEQVLGQSEELFVPLSEPVEYSERLASMEPIRTKNGIELAIESLLVSLCKKLAADGLGLRQAALQCFRVDGKELSVSIGTSTASVHVPHLFKLFELKVDSIEPRLGIELFVLEALQVEELAAQQEVLWRTEKAGEEVAVSELLDRITGKLGAGIVHRYLPLPHHWPERSVKVISDFKESPVIDWRRDRARPVTLLSVPEAIQVTAPIPDYPPMVFRYQGVTHQVKKADGPERIEREWWIQEGEHRDYYSVEDEHGKRYWLFRSGHYDAERKSGWFIHGFFA
ncbi:DNA polymerase Y family protein [Pedobacter aquatilis]|uniref:Y-family DNA polymerase n=1 Tax=Pedobacter aquatilis TaxID=351343 RepID=UPI002930D0A9|nr:DNA polymerase Y family protein [Pedobacter aquatilis]